MRLQCICFVFAVLCCGVLPRMAHGKPAATNCSISVSTVDQLGTKSNRVYRLHRKAKADCARAAGNYQPNFDPKHIASKKVTYVWGQGK